MKFPASATHDAADGHPVRSAMVLVAMEPDQFPRYAWESSIAVNEGAGRSARLRVRTRLTVARWAGDVEVAARVAEVLVDNAGRHGQPFANGFVDMRLRVFPGTDELCIEVDDAVPEFANFAAVTSPSHEQGRGLGRVRGYGGRVSWCPRRDADDMSVGKTVTARLLPNGQDAA
ncbi:hypothetical protein JK361_33400 [Streptomyces sp. 5-8]|uniref:Histidine kinase/HSP90-like ATPase domain-containing protein n=1 Tax=Streptomyces musisoli TaxID=2802280 RepID=A0ABS1PAL8_9ACTN|nr:hypothetical protein [Streptomyces musisoli]MBL1109422.1 hypothetical protein [Streptomyces musisoli]